MTDSGGGGIGKAAEQLLQEMQKAQQEMQNKAPGQAPRLDAKQRHELVQLVEDGPIPASHGVVRWRLSAGARPC